MHSTSIVVSQARIGLGGHTMGRLRFHGVLETNDSTSWTSRCNETRILVTFIFGVGFLPVSVTS